MSDELRRRALESGKTTSNKSRSRQSSRLASQGNSKPGSRPTSRPTSRDPSPDDGFLSDDTNQRYTIRSLGHEPTLTCSLSINSVDALLEADDLVNESATAVLKEQLRDTMADLLDRKGSSSLSRVENTTKYVRILTAHHVADPLYGKVADLLSIFARSVKTEKTELEALMALRAIAMTAISFADESIYENVNSAIKQSISDSQYNKVKAMAIHTLAICLFFGGADDGEAEETMTFLLEIVSSDGAFINADDNAEAVTAALQAYGFLATEVDDMENESEDAISAFLDQLDSTDAHVQIAAGENVALLYEKSYTPIEEDETFSDVEEQVDGFSSSDEKGDDSLVKRYNAYHNKRDVVEKVSALANLSTKSMNRRDKKQIHKAFVSILATIEEPRIGLRTATGIMTIKIHQDAEMKVDQWWKLMRLNAIRRLLANGFVNHYYEGNSQVLDALPIIMRDTEHKGPPLPSGLNYMPKLSKGRYRDQRRFVSAGQEI